METSNPPDVLRRDLALRYVDGDGTILAGLIDIFFSELPAMLSAIRKAVEDEDPSALDRAAHRFKGSVSVFGAAEATEAALRLEAMGRNGNLDGVGQAWQEFEKRIAALKPALLHFRNELRSPNTERTISLPNLPH